MKPRRKQKPTRTAYVSASGAGSTQGHASRASSGGGSNELPARSMHVSSAIGMHDRGDRSFPPTRRHLTRLPLSEQVCRIFIYESLIGAPARRVFPDHLIT